MSALNLDRIPPNATGLRLYKVVKERLYANELVTFAAGRDGVFVVLSRAGISGLVEVDPPGALLCDQTDYFADIYEGPFGNDGWNVSVALDRNSYKALKQHWMRCGLEK